MLDLPGLFLKRNPIAKIQIFSEIYKSCPEFCAVFFLCFSRKIKHPFFLGNLVSIP